MMNISTRAIRLLLSLIAILLSFRAGAKLFECRYEKEKFEKMIFAPTGINYFDTIPYMYLDTCVINSYMEFRDVMDGVKPYDLKRLQYLIEYSYLDGKLDYAEFCKPFDELANLLSKFIKINHLEQYKTAQNYALFEYFSHPSIMNGNKAITYDFVDPMGHLDYTNTFASKVLKTHTGQCWSMAVAYKIVCDALGGDSHIAYSPMHAYIKHLGEDGKWVGINLVNGAPVTDKWLIMTNHITAESIANGIFLRPTSNDELVGQMLMELACMYQHKYQRYDYFTLLCADVVLSKFPTNIKALIVKGNSHRELGLNYIYRYGDDTSDFLELHHGLFMQTYDKIDELGYTTYTEDEYNQWVKEAMEQLENEGLINSESQE